MPFTVRGFLKDNGRALEDSIYADCKSEMLDFLIYSGDFYKMAEEDGKAVLLFKNVVRLMDFEQLKKILPDLDKVGYPHRELYPYCVGNLESFAAALRDDPDSTAVEGGPCLFSLNEVIAEITLLSGKKAYFDYSEGRAYKGTEIPNTEKEAEGPEDEEELVGDEEGFAEFVRGHIQEICDIHFYNYKTGISPQEYLHLRVPFDIASALGTRLVVTLPDMSYRKYLSGALQDAEPAFRERVMEEFDSILYRVTDEYLDLIRRLQEVFRIRNLKILHGRDEQLLKMFYEGREPFIERKKILRNLTSLPEKRESIKDYISMPALPYYLFGATKILEVNSVVEVDSFRKCAKAHKRAAEFSCILFPELLSVDGVHTIYFAQPEDKEYGKYPPGF